MKEPVLVIMAAGMGSRYGGLKQIDPVDESGHLIIDFSIYDAIQAGFKKIIFIIKKADETEFKEMIGDRIQKWVEVEYVYQELDYLPVGISIPEGRTKPYGTGHAILCCENIIKGPFGVINADDYYGKNAFSMLYHYLSKEEDGEVYHYTMIGYILENTLTEHGHVARGICVTDENGYLVDIEERTRIEKRNSQAAYFDETDQSWVNLSGDSVVSMNMWGFSESILKELKQYFALFIEENFSKNPTKCEFYLPMVIKELLKKKKASIKVQISPDKWFGVTYRADKPAVMDAILLLKKEGVYPNKLWEV